MGFESWSYRLLRVLVAGLLWTTSPSPVQAAAGDPDLRFGDHGRVTLPGPLWSPIVLPLEDGGVLAIGSWGSANSSNPQRTLMYRVAADGRVAWSRQLFAGNATAAIRLRDGRVLVAGYILQGGFWIVDPDSPAQGAEQPVLALSTGNLTTDLPWYQYGPYVNSMLELPSGEVVFTASAIDARINTAWDPAMQGVLGRLDSRLLLADPPRPAETRLSQRAPRNLLPRPDGSLLFVVAPDCCASFAGGIAQSPDGRTFELGPPLPGMTIDSLVPAHDGSKLFALGTGPLSADGRYAPLRIVAVDWQGKPSQGFATATSGLVELPAPPVYPYPALVGLVPRRDGGALLIGEAKPRYDRPRDDDGLRVRTFLLTADGRLLDEPSRSARWSLDDDPDWFSSRHLLAIATTADAAWLVTGGESNADTLHPESANTRPNLGLWRMDTGESTGPGAVGFETASFRIGEGRGPREVRVLRVGGRSGALRVGYSTTLDAVDAADRSDFVAADGTLDWADGDDSARTVTLQAPDDALLEGEERFGVRLTPVTPGVQLAAATLQVMIEDDEALREVRVVADASRVDEGRPATFTLRLARPVPGPVVISVLIGDAVDDDGWPRYDGRNSSGIGRQLVGWAAGSTATQSVVLRTNRQFGAQPDVELFLQVAGAFAPVSTGSGFIGARATVVDVAENTPTTTAVTPASTTTVANSGAGAASGGGGTIRWPVLALLLLTLASRARSLTRTTSGIAGACRVRTSPRHPPSPEPGPA